MRKSYQKLGGVEPCKKGKTADRTKIVEQGQSGVEGKQAINMESYKSKNRDRILNNTEDQSISMSHGSQHVILGTLWPAKTH